MRTYSMTSFVLSLLVAFTLLSAKPAEKTQEIVSIVNMDENYWQSFVYDNQISELRLDTLRKIRFWSTVMSTSEKMVILNHAQSRRIFHVLALSDWKKLTEDEQMDYRDFLRNEFCLDSNDRIFATRGKAEFYQFRRAMPGIDRGIEVFLDNGVDPWYAQAILLIESPGNLLRSPVGAMGSFQLMSKVARKYGLRVDSKVDERKDFDRSAYGASQLIKNICIPYTREMLSQREHSFEENDLFFRLLVLHVYHAGAYNVKNALAQIDSKYEGFELIQQLWETEAKGFRNASQNYSQVALAGLIKLEDLISERCVIYHLSEVPFPYSAVRVGEELATAEK
ncbi:MAG: transglycosylase SLT domain-containing protein [Vicingaceae bacterium]